MIINRLKRTSLTNGIVANGAVVIRAVVNRAIAIAAAAVVLSLSACTDEKQSTEDKVASRVESLGMESEPARSLKRKLKLRLKLLSIAR